MVLSVRSKAPTFFVKYLRRFVDVNGLADDLGRPVAIEIGRNVLKSVVGRFTGLNVHPVIALEKQKTEF
jgi:hypothetical protein